jgi:hypothetical protein
LSWVSSSCAEDSETSVKTAMTAKVLKVSAHCSWRLGDSLAFGAGLAWGLRDERVPHAGVPEIVTRSSLNPQDYGLRGCGSAVAIATSFSWS